MVIDPANHGIVLLRSQQWREEKRKAQQAHQQSVPWQIGNPHY
jgi:hypothetical protein